VTSGLQPGGPTARSARIRREGISLMLYYIIICLRLESFRATGTRPVTVRYGT
jgi:hypothetical protein